MAIFKCKMCGGNLNIVDDSTVCECDYCGTLQTIPKINSERIARLFARANDYRFEGEFDKAYSAYESLAIENPEEPEAYWGMVLSEYGIEYVNDGKNGKKIPTCHRTKVQSITSNKNYKKAIEYSAIECKALYEDEAETIDRLQKKILSISSKEDKYDIFVCYKETDENGDRTKDSVVAEEIFDSLSKEGYKVFFSRISLEDKLGIDYEPFIFNALNSSKVLIHVSTSNENSNSTWVKNEWKRYISFTNEDPSKTIVPVIKDMSVYELPDEMQRFQVLDFNKLGSTQDLVRGINKIFGRDLSKGLSTNEKEILNDLKDKAEKNERNKNISLNIISLIFGAFISMALAEFFGRTTYIYSKLFEGKLLLIILAIYIFVELLLLTVIKKGFKSLATFFISLLIFIVISAIYFVTIGLNFTNNIWVIYSFYTIVGLILCASLHSLMAKKSILPSFLVVLILAGFAILTFRGNGTVYDSTKEQIIVVNDYVNIRKQPEGEIISKAYRGQIFNCYGTEKVNGNNYYWIKTEEPFGFKMCVSEKNNNTLLVKNLSGVALISNAKKAIITNEYINIRQQASSSSEKLGIVYSGDIVSVEYAGKEGWYKILSPGKSGYIYCTGNAFIVN